VVPIIDTKIKRNQLPPLSKNWHQLQLHPHREGFLAAIHKKHQTMLNKGVWKKINQQKNFKRLLPFIWVWTYKFDENNHLAKYKTRFVARNDLQPASEKSTYAATLAAKFFRILMVYAA
jgi:hypothetical protein